MYNQCLIFLRYYFNIYLFPNQRMNKFVHLIEINNSIQEENWLLVRYIFFLSLWNLEKPQMIFSKWLSITVQTTCCPSIQIHLLKLNPDEEPYKHLISYNIIYRWWYWSSIPKYINMLIQTFDALYFLALLYWYSFIY